MPRESNGCTTAAARASAPDPIVPVSLQGVGEPHGCGPIRAPCMLAAEEDEDLVHGQMRQIPRHVGRLAAGHVVGAHQIGPGGEQLRRGSSPGGGLAKLEEMGARASGGVAFARIGGHGPDAIVTEMVVDHGAQPGRSGGPPPRRQVASARATGPSGKPIPPACATMAADGRRRNAVAITIGHTGVVRARSAAHGAVLRRDPGTAGDAARRPRGSVHRRHHRPDRGCLASRDPGHARNIPTASS